MFEEKRFYRIRDLYPKGQTRLLPFSETFWREGVKEGRHPQPRRFGDKIVAWKGSVLNDFLEN